MVSKMLLEMFDGRSSLAILSIMELLLLLLILTAEEVNLFDDSESKVVNGGVSMILLVLRSRRDDDDLPSEMKRGTNVMVKIFETTLKAETERFFVAGPLDSILIPT